MSPKNGVAAVLLRARVLIREVNPEQLLPFFDRRYGISDQVANQPTV